ncbi:hypothetical protein VP01_2150g1 [Puccinia sorghi]|uniref:Uncharacterized protein n=1 Tax=Puccinia sorghi TaxID=27349 RepID=A0A0L6V9K1_9BASI|nr:hypothetical protein VP01_2150g1 [Puccinia sorghi]
MHKDPFLSVNVSPDLTSSSTQKLSSAWLPILKSLGADSNYLDWELVVMAYLEAVYLEYVTIDSANLHHIREHCCNTHGMWSALLKAQQHSTTGGRIYWLCKLLLARMEGDEILGHINTMAQYYKRRRSYRSTPELHPQHCMSALMNQDDMKTEAIVSALKNEHTLWQSQPEAIASILTAKAKTQPPKCTNDTPRKAHLHCVFCNMDRHNLNGCNNTCRILSKHKASQKERLDSSDHTSFEPNAAQKHTLFDQTSPYPF